MSQEFTLLCFINKTQDNNTNQLILTLLRKCITLFNIYYKINCSFSETNKDYIFYIPVEIDPNKENQKRKELQKLFLSFFSQEHTFLMNYYKLTSSSFKPFPLPQINFKWKSNIIRDTEQRLPELKGIFEDARAHKGPDVLFQTLYVTFNEIKDKSLSAEFEKCLIKLKNNIEAEHGWGRSNFAGRQCEIKQKNEQYTFVVKHVPFTAIETDPKQKPHAENNLNNTFWTMLYDIFHWKKDNAGHRLKLNVKALNYQWKNNIKELEQRLPELKGIFEAVELDPHFSLTNEEKNAITELSEKIQNIIQENEHRILRMMEVLKKQTLHLQDKKLDKYIAIVHLREDLRITIGKICDKHFSPLNIISLPYWYQRVFDKAIKGVGEKVRDGGITFVNEDDVLEIVFDTYQYFLGERIIPSKRIETSEIKDFLTKFFPLSLNATITKHPFAFSSEYLELRKEKTKFNIVNQRLPELEGIF